MDQYRSGQIDSEVNEIQYGRVFRYLSSENFLEVNKAHYYFPNDP